MDTNQHKGKAEERKAKEAADKATGDKGTASKGQPEKHGGKEGAVLGNINDDAKKKTTSKP